MIKLIGKKIGMTRIFTEEGISIPVTVVTIYKHQITQIKNKKKDGYNAIQITSGEKKHNINKAELGHYLKNNIKPGLYLHECRIKNDKKEDIKKYKIGQFIDIEIFHNVKKVDVIGTSKGKGFAGTVKRWNFHTQDASHGNSLSHRAPGSIGQNQTPGKVFKGKKMSGQLGNKQITIQNLKIIKIDNTHNFLLLKGSVPGPTGTKLIIKPSVKIES
ncbi:MAG: 50S ribosomal protein L3 [Arsenophonus sp.]|nr:MAG: 50S ribosomal protein L3 [Arsenophonus sp.]